MLDGRDRQLLKLLQDDADLPVATLADRVALSVSSCSRRIQRLRDDGYIRARIALLDRKRMGVPMTVFVVISSSRHSAEWVAAFRTAISDIPEIVEAHRVTGSVDYLLKLVLVSIEHYDDVYKRLTHRIELSGVSAYISMETLKTDTGIPTDYAV